MVPFREDCVCFGSGKEHEKGKAQETAGLDVQMDMTRQKCPSQGSALAQQVAQRESGLACAFVFEGTASEDGETSVKAGTCQGESRVGKCVGCLQPSGKEARAWESTGQPMVEMAKGAGQAEGP